MTKLRAGAVLLWTAVCSCGAQARPTARAAAAPLSYVVTIAEPGQKHFHVKLTFQAGAGRVRLMMPDYTPGSLLQNNAKYVSKLACTTPAGPVGIDRFSASEWEIHLARPARLTVEYDVEPNTDDALRLTTNSLTPQGGFFHGTTLFLVPAGSQRRAAELRIVLPQGWKVATNLPLSGAGYRARDYAELVTTPVQCGEWTERLIQHDNVDLRLVFDRPLPAYDETALDQRLAGIAAHHVGFFGSAPFQQLLVLVHWRPDLQFGGGVARRSTLVINVGKDWMPDLAANLAGTFAHELFHAWNFGAFHPRIPGGPTFLHEHDARNGESFMWFIEGVTNYYVLRTFARIGHSPRQAYLDWLSNDITEFETSPARGWMSLDDADAAVWAEPAQSLPIADGGEVAGLILDLAIRRASHHRASLDDVMRRLYQESRQPGYEGYTNGSFAALVSQAAGQDLTPLLRTLLETKRRWDYGTLLRDSGLAVVPTATEPPAFSLRVGDDLTPEQKETIATIFSNR